MPVKLFVGGLSFTTTNDSLRAAFARFGMVGQAIVMTDRATGRSRGFGFVEMGTQEEADRAIGGLNGSSLDGRMIRVDKATPRGTAPPGGVRRPGGPPSGRPSFGGAGGGGGGGRRWRIRLAGPGHHVPNARGPGAPRGVAIVGGAARRPRSGGRGGQKEAGRPTQRRQGATKRRRLSLVRRAP